MWKALIVFPFLLFGILSAQQKQKTEMDKYYKKPPPEKRIAPTGKSASVRSLTDPNKTFTMPMHNPDPGKTFSMPMVKPDSGVKFNMPFVSPNPENSFSMPVLPNVVTPNEYLDKNIKPKEKEKFKRKSLSIK